MRRGVLLFPVGVFLPPLLVVKWSTEPPLRIGDMQAGVSSSYSGPRRGMQRSSPLLLM